MKKSTEKCYKCRRPVKKGIVVCKKCLYKKIEPSPILKIYDKL